MSADEEQAASRTGEGSGLEPLRSWLSRLARSAADTIVPPLCLSCRQPLATYDTLCAPCWSRVDFIRPPVCDRLGLPLPYDLGPGAVSAAASADPPVYGRARAVAHYGGLVRSLVTDLKFHDRDELVGLLAAWMTSAGAEILDGADLMIPVPLSRMRLASRRFNQSARLADGVARRAGMTCDPHSLVRVKHTRPQLGLSRTERLDNLRGAFAVRPDRRKHIENRRIVLVDDVVTTGTTISAAARALYSAGAENVDVLALALVTGGGLDA
ncbi:MAG: ComF family protein [Hyphomicrobium sp.]|nr:ComF family protein [Hyphomicrobium sp.]